MSERPRPWMQAHPRSRYERRYEDLQNALFAVLFVVILFAVTLAPVQ